MPTSPSMRIFLPLETLLTVIVPVTRVNPGSGRICWCLVVSVFRSMLPMVVVPTLTSTTPQPGHVLATCRAKLGIELAMPRTKFPCLRGVACSSREHAGSSPELFAADASIALGRKRYEHQLAEAVASRQVMGTAVGILMCCVLGVVGQALPVE